MGAGFKFVGHEVGLHFEFRDGTGASETERAEVIFQAGADVEDTGALGAEQAFVAGHGEEINVVGLHVDGDMASGLGGIDEEGDAMVPGDLADRRGWAGASQ